MRRAWLIGALLVAGGCGDDAALDRTLATVETIRGATALDDEPAARLGRAAADQSVAVADGAMARLSLDSGPRLLLDGGSRVTLVDEHTVHLDAGRVWAEAAEGDELFVETEAGNLRASDASLSIRGDTAYVVRGEVSWRAGEARGVARAGERLSLSEPGTEAVTLWRDWTGGLARPGPGDAEGPSGVGVLEARVPDEVGRARWPLVIRRLDVKVRVVGDLAVTEVEQEFFNPASETVEGTYRIRVPRAAVLQRFAVDRNGRLVDGYVREKAQARQDYEAQVYRGSTLDPALLEWVAPGRYQARIYPIRPGETRRIVVRYAEWLEPVAEDGPRLYRYPMGAGRNAPRIQELSIAVDLEDAGAERVRAGMGAAIEEGRVRLRRSDFAPRSDFWLELDGGPAGQRAWRAPHEPPPRAPDAQAVVGEADERDYWYLPLRLPEALFEDASREGMDLVIVADVSAATDRSHLELGRSVAEAITTHLGEDDRVAIVTSDLTIRPLGDEPAALGPASGERVERLLDGLARAPAGGATDLGGAIGAAADLLDPERPGAVVYVGDGAPTVGELEADGLLERLARLPAPLRLYAVGVGGEADLDLLQAVTRGGGLALRVEERSSAADAALSILAHAARPVAQRVTVDVGTGVENVYPRRPVDVVRGEVLPVVGRIREAPPAEVTVRGTVAGEEFEETIALTTGEAEQSTDLRLRWAGERLQQLLLEGAGREEVAELGTRYGLITPFTSYYVPSAQELNRLGAAALPLVDRPDVLAEADARRDSWGEIALAVALGPLSIAGCAEQSAEAPAVAEEEAAPVAAAEATEAEGGDMGAADEGERTANRYAIQGPADDSDPQMAREQARAGAASGGIVGALEEAEPAEPVAAQPAAPPAPSTGAEIVDPWGGSGPSGGSAGGYGRGAGGGGAATGRASAVAEDGDERRARTRRRRGSRGPTRSDDSGGAANALRLLEDAEPAEEPEAESRTDASDEPLAGLDGIFGGGGMRAPSAPASGSPSGATARQLGRGFFETNEDVTVRVTTTELPRVDATDHARRRCSDAADLPLEDREALWDERLGERGTASGWLAIYRQAIRRCEAPTWRDRRALLGRVLRRAGTVERMVDVYRLSSSGAARSYMRAAILRRVRSPQDLRAVRAAFGLGADPDWELVAQVLERARGEAGRIRALRRLTMQYPHSFELKLRLLTALETAGRRAEAKRLADRLRADPRSDAGVRTAVGEMFLRMDLEEEARRVFSEIVEFAPLDELARRRLGDLYRAHGWFEDAYRQYETLASIRPDDPVPLLLMAQAAAGAGRVDEALRLEQRLMETAQPGAERGIARIAQLWTSARLAKLRVEARAEGDDDKLEALERRMRRSGVLQGAGDLRVTLTWSHPDAQIALYAAHPDGHLARPEEIAPEHGIEAFEVPEVEDGAYRVEVRRADPESPTEVAGELLVVWHEGRDDERVEVVPLRFADGRADYAWTLEDGALNAAE
ncbi:MAG TPA: VIT domain-containing protein [Sandaracinaceae bacterium LLY-WYZ-13_1]|nr:VIT domain-containing protein [Sandaracinaceae bacterium LLY-WYZ-13_1]